ncbi:MAG TPA: 3'(2'),5'-bisphosphate nucleotidase CysQ [Allosphingosinicella sp.]|nr:3'(2'),5'-bisphosphate nucleotidase CysQ [Allosphingosinicella sp.]
MEQLSDAELAARTAEAAGRLLVDLRAGGLPAGPAIGVEGDRRANRLILAALARWRPGDGILSEESPDGPERLAKSRVWIVDPLDGTREYVEGRDDWAVHVALAVDGEAVAGAVAMPTRGRVFRSDDAPAPRLELKRRPVMVISRTRPPPETEPLAAALDAEVRQIGSAGAKAMAVVAGEADIYFHAGGQHEWDNCAPVAVAKAAGLHASRGDGSPLVYNRERPFLPDLLICRPEFAKRALDALARL